MQLLAANTQRYDIGRAAIWRRTVWDGTDNLFDDFVHIGNTEGAIDIAVNPEYSELTLPETSGPAAIKRFLAGEHPEFELGIFPSEAGLALFTPTARGTAGLERRRTAREHTLWIVPEELFLKRDAGGNMVEVEVTYEIGEFLKDGLPLTAEEQLLVDMSMVIWRADFSRSTPLYRHEDGGKSLRSVTVRAQQDFTKPDGAQLYLIMGELGDFPDIGIEPLGGIVDNFNRANGALGNADTGQTWGNLANVTAAIVSNQLRITGGTEEKAAALITQPGLVDGTGQVTRVAGSHNRVYGRATSNTDPDNCIRCHVQSDQVVLQKVVAGAITQLGIIFTGIVNGDTFGLRLAGTSVKALRNGIEVISATESFNSDKSTWGVGQFHSFDQGTILDNFSVTT